MIRFTLRCDNDHRFESWFASNAAFDTLAAAGQVACPDCGSARVEKSLMAPAVAPERSPGPGRERLSPATAREKALAALREKVERESDYVGLSFAAEARAMHEGDKPARPIHGEAKLADARRLIEDGIPVAPLPFTPTRKVN
ncbi:DUF1178 family protein [Wenxinia saemankumensis]|uniref:Uncharacterized protein n=1 Tax=Wenxinia saemankumensis TaxID=1447782 RepID=A0A1M6CQJ8_9RHOB|nr:DUF1178 family protein [Wenxinia saemankumensis]SHI63008.1 hypothetical protein SAMN05444417_1303 [Wenxinia saemankumensis]